MTKILLKVYFWLMVALALLSVVVLAYLALQDSSTILASAWILLAQTLLFPAYGFLYRHKLPFHPIWWVHTPTLIVVAIFTTFGFIEIQQTISLSGPEPSLWSFIDLAIHAPMYVMAGLYLMNAGDGSDNKPNKSFNTDAGKAGAG